MPAPAAARGRGDSGRSRGHRAAAARPLFNMHGVGTSGNRSRACTSCRKKKSICYLFLKSIDFGMFFPSPTPLQNGGPHLITPFNDFSLLCYYYFMLRAGAGWSFLGGGVQF